MASVDIPIQVFVSIHGEQFGPVDMAQLQAWIDENRVIGQMACWHQGLPEWMPLSRAFPHLFAVTPPPPPPISLSGQIPPPFSPPPPAVVQKPRNTGIWPWLILALILVAGVVVIGYFLIPKFFTQGNRTVKSVTAECMATVRIIEGEESDLSSIAVWQQKLAPVLQNVDETAVVCDGNTLKMSSTQQNQFTGGTISETIEIELSSDWTHLVRCVWTRKEETGQNTVVSRVEVNNLDSSSAVDSNRIVFSCKSLECGDFLTLSETVDWPGHPEFNQHIDEVFWGKEGSFILTIEIAQP